MPKFQASEPQLPEITRRLQAILRIAHGTALLTVGVAACDEGERWTPITCSDYSRPTLADPIRPAGSIDFVSIEEVDHFGDMTWRATVLQSSGGPCRSAPDPVACMAMLAEVRGTDACASDGCRFAIAGSKGVFQRLDRREALVTALGEIDGVSEALLMAGFTDQVLSCPTTAVDGQWPLAATMVRETGDGFELLTEYDLCEDGIFRDRVRISRSGEVERVAHTHLRNTNCATGRRPAGLCDLTPVQTGSSAGTFLARAAQLEAASVYAFRQLLRELEVLGAPEALRAAARAALADELAHAAAMARLARRHGAEVRSVVVRSIAPRRPVEIARENAEEGCVRETFGALLAAHQAAYACDPEVREVMTRIAGDELRHAALAWAVAAWLEPRLSPGERRQVELARADALRSVRDGHDVGLSASARALLGYPSPERAAELSAHLPATRRWTDSVSLASA